MIIEIESVEYKLIMMFPVVNISTIKAKSVAQAIPLMAF